MTMKKDERFLLHVDESLQPEELDKRLQRPTLPPPALKQDRLGWRPGPIAWRHLIKKVLNRFPFLWRPARWIYNHLYINRHFYHLNTRQEMLEGQFQQISQHLNNLESEYQAFSARAHAWEEALSKRMERLTLAMDRAERKIEEQELALRIKTTADQSRNTTTTLIESSRLDRFYLHFENRFRGEESAIGAYQRRYLTFIPSIAKEKPVLDIGCGRGEWLALLREQGFLIEGVDMTRTMVEHCRKQGLPVRCEDGFTTLERASAGSYAAITAFHVVEHVPFPKILELMEQAWRVLDDEGVMILETPNPENLQVGAHTFWMDPTHIKPLPPALLAFAAEYVGFERTHIERLHPYPVTPASDPQVRQIQSHLYREQDYALIAWKHAS